MAADDPMAVASAAPDCDCASAVSTFASGRLVWIGNRRQNKSKPSGARMGLAEHLCTSVGASERVLDLRLLAVRSRSDRFGRTACTIACHSQPLNPEDLCTS